MFFMPFDLFGSFVKGREMAIAANWQDRKNYNADIKQQLDNLLNSSTLHDKVRQSHNMADLSDQQVKQAMQQTARGQNLLDVENVVQPGALATAGAESDFRINEIKTGDYNKKLQLLQDVANVNLRYDKAVAEGNLALLPDVQEQYKNNMAMNKWLYDWLNNTPEGQALKQRLPAGHWSSIERAYANSDKLETFQKDQQPPPEFVGPPKPSTVTPPPAINQGPVKAPAPKPTAYNVVAPPVQTAASEIEFGSPEWFDSLGKEKYPVIYG